MAVSAFSHPIGMAPTESGQPQDAQPSEGGKANSSSLRKFQAVLEEGHAAAGTTLCLAVSCGLLLGFLLPKDPSIPGTVCCMRFHCQAWKRPPSKTDLSNSLMPCCAACPRG